MSYLCVVSQHLSPQKSEVKVKERNKSVVFDNTKTKTNGLKEWEQKDEEKEETIANCNNPKINWEESKLERELDKENRSQEKEIVIRDEQGNEYWGMEMK